MTDRPCNPRFSSTSQHCQSPHIPTRTYPKDQRKMFQPLLYHTYGKTSIKRKTSREASVCMVPCTFFPSNMHLMLPRRHCFATVVKRNQSKLTTVLEKPFLCLYIYPVQKLFLFYFREIYFTFSAEFTKILFFLRINKQQSKNVLSIHLCFWLLRGGSVCH